jgi:hypothetical protein
VEEDFPRRVGGSDILTEMADSHPLLHLPRFEENDPSTKFPPLHPIH